MNLITYIMNFMNKFFGFFKVANEEKREETQKMRKVNYKEKGITLIALVITIILLLILAGVTLSTALSQNGLFKSQVQMKNLKTME